MNNEPSPDNIKEATFLMQNEIIKLSALLFLEESFYGHSLLLASSLTAPRDRYNYQIEEGDF